MKNKETYIFNPDGSIHRIIRNHFHTMYTFHYSQEGYSLKNEFKRLDAISDFYGRRTELIYTDSTSFYPGNLAQIKDWSGRAWTYDYYPDGNLKSVTDPKGHKETYFYNNDGYLDKIQDDDDNVWLENYYDAEGKVYQQRMAGELFL